MEGDASIRLEDVKYEEEVSQEVTNNRREFLSNINLKTVAKTKIEFEKEIQKATDELVEHTLQKSDIALLKQKRITDRRKLLYNVIKRDSKQTKTHKVKER